MVAATILPANIDEFGLADVVEFTERCAAWLTDFDPDVWTRLDARDAVEFFSRLTRVAQAAMVVAAGRVDRTTTWANSPERSAAAYLAKMAGTTAGQADDALRAERQMRELPATAERFRHGDLSLPQAVAVAKGAAADPASEPKLLHTAATSSLGELKKLANEIVVHADPTPDPRPRRQVKRSFRAYAGEDAMRAYSGLLPTGMAGEIESVWNIFTNRAFHEAQRQGKRERQEAYMADGLLAMARAAKAWTDHATSDAPPIRPHFVIRIDITPLLRGTVEPGEVCEIAGVGPIEVVTARHYLPQAILDFVIHEGIDVKTVAHAKRKATRTQLAALLSRDYVCEVEGCDCRKFLEIDHITPYADSQNTDVGELGYKSRHCHDLKSRHGYTDGPLQPNGKRKLIPPTNPPPGAS